MKTNTERIGKAMVFLTLLIILSLSACATVGPDYKTPDISVPEKWQTESPESISTEANKQSEINWWKSFNDPLLTILINRAVSNNLSIKEAAARLTESRARRGIVNADQYPSVNSSASGTKNHSSGMSSEFYRFGFDSSWEIDLFGGIKKSIEAYDADIQAKMESLNSVITSLIAEVALNYVELRLYQSQLGVTRSNLESQEETHEIVYWRYKAGLVTELDLKKSEYTLEQTRSQLPSLQSKIDHAQNRLAVLLGCNPGELEQELSPFKPVPVLQDKIEIGIPADLLRQRPDLRKAERDLAAQTARIGSAVSDLYPKITLSGSIKLESASVSDLFDTNNLSRSIGPSISWPVFRTGAIKSNIEVQSSLAEQRLINYKSIVLSALEEVENALSSCFYEQIKRDSLEKAVKAAEHSYEFSRIQYSSGLVDFQVLLESQRTLLSLQDQLTKSDGQITINYITLYKALGGGWDR
jgi:NodT family efflux transporter outer membrane factor (OMF) lipoprotein